MPGKVEYYGSRQFAPHRVERGFSACKDARRMKAMRDRIGKERGWPPMNRDEFVREADHGSLYVGSPETVARKIAATATALGITRFDMKYSAGALPHEKLMRSIEFIIDITRWDAGEALNALRSIKSPVLVLQSTFVNTELKRVPIELGVTTV